MSSSVPLEQRKSPVCLGCMGKSLAAEQQGKILASYLVFVRLTVEHYIQFWASQNKKNVTLWRPNEVAKELQQMAFNRRLRELIQLRVRRMARDHLTAVSKYLSEGYRGAEARFFLEVCRYDKK